jgi:phage major head subunit gpT-like protein
MPTLNRENFAELLWPNYTKLIGEGYTKKPEQFSKVFRILNSDRAYEKYLHVGTFSPWRRNNEGNVFNESEKVLGPEITIYMHRYDNSFRVTWEYWQDNKAQAMGGKGIGGGAESLGEGLRTRIETEAAGVINRGFSDIGYDGVPLFATNHPLAGKPNETVSNLAPENERAITNLNMEKAITRMKTSQKDETGYLLQVNPNQIVVSPDLYFDVARVFHSTQVAGSDLNDVNELPGMKIVIMDYLDFGIWFLQDTSYENLNFYWREKPIFGYERIQDTMDYKFYGYARFGVGYVDWRGLYGARIGTHWTIGN